MLPVSHFECFSQLSLNLFFPLFFCVCLQETVFTITNFQPNWSEEWRWNPIYWNILGSRTEKNTYIKSVRVEVTVDPMKGVFRCQEQAAIRGTGIRILVGTWHYDLLVLFFVVFLLLHLVFFFFFVVLVCYLQLLDWFLAVITFGTVFPYLFFIIFFFALCWKFSKVYRLVWRYTLLGATEGFVRIFVNCYQLIRGTWNITYKKI